MLYDVIKYNHFSIQEVASILNLSVKELKDKMRRGVFQTNEVEMLLHFLWFPCNPMEIFFDSYDYEFPEKIPWQELVRKVDEGKNAVAQVLHRP